MIEFHVSPVVRRVTVTALRTHRIGVRVITLVAREAVLWCVTMPNVRRVTIAALSVHMTAQQREIRVLVVEVVFIQSDDVSVATLVIGVAPRTRRPARTPVLAVKAGTRIDIGRDFLVAVEAQFTLFAAFETQVAVGALFFVLGVSLYKFARHDQRFELCFC